MHTLDKLNTSETQNLTVCRSMLGLAWLCVRRSKTSCCTVSVNHPSEADTCCLNTKRTFIHNCNSTLTPFALMRRLKVEKSGWGETNHIKLVNNFEKTNIILRVSNELLWIYAKIYISLCINRLN